MLLRLNDFFQAASGLREKRLAFTQTRFSRILGFHFKQMGFVKKTRGDPFFSPASWPMQEQGIQKNNKKLRESRRHRYD
ncbi:hypothetical protein ET33_34170 [Paenibacillus tyrfis]|uniref:Uncharacterized protein n=1 Tax=Paenibacillus tyrfis TaxID=1501230 RepID=A0A081NTD1_9BACL|nr:hypothetical protein ET33_34170 [Paenibacillus tyrfis]